MWTLTLAAPHNPSLLPSPDPKPPWPYPLLCLLWRLGLGGQWLRRPPLLPPDALLVAMARGIAATRGPTGSPAGPPPPAAGLVRVLARAPLSRLSDAVPGQEAALHATARLLGPGAPGTRTAPLGWRAALAAWLPAAPRVWVPRPAPVWDPATWQLIAVLETAWEAEGLTCLGRERPVLFQLAGTRRMAARFGWPHRRALACGRTAYRRWRHFVETQERPRIEQLRGWPLPPAAQRVAGDAVLLYRQARAACRTGIPAPALALLPVPLRLALERAAAASVAALRPPVTPTWPSPDLRPLAAALALSPLGALAGQQGASPEAVHQAAVDTAQGLVRALSAPWPWRPRPVVRGPRRAAQELRRRRAHVVA